MSRYPEHDKLHQVKELSQACGEFLEHLAQSGIVLARHHHHTDECGHIPRKDLREEIPAEECGLCENELFPAYETKEKLLAAHFGIDTEKLESEKRKMLEELHK